jgi:alanyl-tRNA synthetase
MLSSKDIRSLRHTFRESKGHTHFPPASLIADKTSTAMFTVAGMQPLIPYLSGQAHPLGDKLHDIQPCIRTNDIEEVGDNSHHTMFFMMGNWSLGNYFKKDAIWRSWEFLTQHLKLDPRKIAVTAYVWDDIVPQDSETASLRAEQWIPSDKISFLDANDNRWSPWPVGPCGPCTEMYYWIGESEYPGPDDNVKNDDSKWLEIWNNVFMEFYRDESGKLTKLEKQNVDTGMWFERICKVLQGKLSPYETDLFAPTIEVIEKLTGKSYAYFTTSQTPSEQASKEAASMRIIADHMRCATFLMAEWLIPSNEGRGYVLRRIVEGCISTSANYVDESKQFSDTIKIFVEPLSIKSSNNIALDVLSYRTKTIRSSKY